MPRTAHASESGLAIYRVSKLRGNIITLKGLQVAPAELPALKVLVATIAIKLKFPSTTTLTSCYPCHVPWYAEGGISERVSAGYHDQAIGHSVIFSCTVAYLAAAEELLV